MSYDLEHRQTEMKIIEMRQLLSFVKQLEIAMKN